MNGHAKIAVIILAAGKSRRFGVSDKLMSPYKGKPLAAHVAASLQGLPFSFGVIVARNAAVAALFRDKRLRPLFPKNTSKQSDTLKAGLQYVQSRGASHALLLLADMPNVPRDYLKQMIALADTHPLISQYGNATLPPALIPHHLFGKLLQLCGDQGAARILKYHPSLVRLKLDASSSIDVDFKECSSQSYSAQSTPMTTNQP